MIGPANEFVPLTFSMVPLLPAVKGTVSLKVKRGNDVFESYDGATMDRESPRYVETMVNGASQYIWLSPPAGKIAIMPAPKANHNELSATAPRGDLPPADRYAALCLSAPLGSR